MVPVRTALLGHATEKGFPDCSCRRDPSTRTLDRTSYHPGSRSPIEASNGRNRSRFGATSISVEGAAMGRSGPEGMRAMTALMIRAVCGFGSAPRRTNAPLIVIGNRS